MRKSIFLTSGSIDYSLPKIDLYESIVRTSLGLQFPNLREEAKEDIKKRIKELDLKNEKLKIFSASSKQTKETAVIFGQILNIPYEVDVKLDPILFDFRKIMSREEFELLGEQAFDVARPRFLKSFHNNELLESKLSVKKRLDSFLARSSRESRTFLAISHSFLLMIMRVYLVAGKKVFDDYMVLKKLCRPQNRPFRFLEGFEVELDKNLKARRLSMLK